jgi:hypothetical protein
MKILRAIVTDALFWLLVALVGVCLGASVLLGVEGWPLP